jgi:hypothetical protein
MWGDDGRYPEDGEQSTNTGWEYEAAPHDPTAVLTAFDDDPTPSAPFDGFYDPTGTDGTDGTDGTRPGGWGGRLQRLATPRSLITLVVVTVCVIFVFVELEPSQIFLNTTPAGGDLGAHVWLPAFIKSHFLPNLQVTTGWSPDWYAGFPPLTYFFPLPTWAIVFLSYVVPYNIAFKLVAVSGLLTLPIASWAFGRLARMPFPGPACLAVASVAYLFGREFTIYGGNIASTMAGEYDFSIALSFALLFLGLVARGLRTGKHRALAAVVLAATAFSHILPLFFAIGGTLIWTAMSWDRRKIRWAIVVLVVGGALTAFWSLPFEHDLPYSTDVGYQKLTTYLVTLFPSSDVWLYLLATVGTTLSLVRRNRTGIFLALMAVGAALVFRIAPQGELWNARVLPFWFLLLYLLAGVALAEGGAVAVGAIAKIPSLVSRPGFRSGGLVTVPAVALVIGLIWVGFPLQILPLGHVEANGRYDWLGLTSTDKSFVPDWVNWDLSGYQSPGKPSRSTYTALIDTMKHLGSTLGCGRAMYEYEPAINDFGTPDALMLLPYWTNGCIDSMEGLYYESSATTPYHFLNAAELSEQPSNPVVGLDYPTGPDVSEGIQHLQMFGVKYFMAVSPQVEAQAAADPSLKLLASVGPYPTDVTNSENQSVVENQTWKIYEISDSPLVQPLTNQPVVMTGVDHGGTPWLTASERWYLDPSDWSVYEAASGPASWTRVSPKQTDLPVKAEPHVTVDDVAQGEESMSFNVSRTGVPILVKTSYFPNWHVHGATGVYRVAPNLMVVVPTAKHVTLTYGYTTTNWIGTILTVLGAVALAGLIFGGRIRMKLQRRGKRASLAGHRSTATTSSAV